jgi:hypothetical protein
MVSVFATGPKVHTWLKAMDFLRAIKIRSTPTIGEEVKPSALCRKILRHIKDPFKV